jgi:hypothetical protein
MTSPKRPAYPWKRFWIARDSAYSTDKGFLQDPESEYAWAYPNRAVSLAELREKPALILLGEAGMGKSQSLLDERDALAASLTEDTCLLYRNLNIFGSGELQRLMNELFRGPEYAAYREGARLIVLLDSLDEAINDTPNLGNWLASQLRQHVVSPERLHLRIASRTAAWQGSLEEAVGDIWATENVGIYEICPLRRTDVAVAADARAIDGKALLEEIQKREIEALASRPVTLEFLFSQWGEVTSLPHSKADLYEKGILALCDENNPERRARSCLIDPRQRMTVAGRLASALILCGHAALWTGRIHETPAGDIALADLAGTERHGANEFRVDENALRETLEISGLFTGFGCERMGFAHQSFAEFLAAWYLKKTATETGQKLRPLHDHEGGKLVPKLAETAAWLASLDRPVLDHLIDHQPEALLHVDGAALTNDDKASIVQSLLDKIADRTLFPHDLPQRTLRKLAHPGLTDLLRPWIANQAQHRQSRDFAMDMARWCGVHELAGDLAQVALDDEEDYYLRIAATHAVVWIDNRQALAALKPLALGAAGPDSERRLRNLALDALWPEFLTAEEFFADPVETGDNARIGALEVSISNGKFFETLSPEHMPAALAWTARHTMHLGYSASKLKAGLMRTAWSFIEEPGILDIFVETMLAFLDQHAHLFHDYGERQGDDPLADTRKRRLLLVRLLGRVPLEQTHSLFFYDRIVREDDIPWLLDLLDTGLSNEECRCASQLISNLLRFDAPQEITNRILDRCGVAAEKPDILLRKAMRWLVHPMRLKTQSAQQARSFWCDEQERRDRRQPVLLDPPPEERVRAELERCEEGDYSAWSRLAMELTLTPDGRDYVWPQKLDALPGWQAATEEIRDRILAAAMAYLEYAAPDTDKLYSSTSFFFEDVAGLFAFEALSQTDPNRLVRLGNEHWAKWAPLVMCGYHENQEWLQALRREAYRHAPEAAFDAALACIDKADQQEPGLTSLHDYEFLWGPAFVAGLVDRLDNAQFKPQSRRTILEHLLKRDECIGRERARRFLAQTDDADLRRNAATLLLTWDGAESWPLLSPLLEQEPEFAESFVEQVAHDMRWHRPEKPAHSLNVEQLAVLYLWMESRFPAAQDPVHHGAYSPSLRDHIKELRDSLISGLEAAGTWPAVLALERIAAVLPDRDWLKWVCYRARNNAMNAEWRPMAWIELSGLLNDPAARIVRAASDLQGVVLESLSRLQEHLHGMTPLAPFLWDEAAGKPKSEGRLSDFIKFHLSNDLNRRGVLINREVELRNWPDKGRGESLDLLVQAIRHDETPIDLIVEVKGCWNGALDAAMESQLRDRYLVGSYHTHGIYLVGWFASAGGGKGCKQELLELRGRLDEQAKLLTSGSVHIRAVVMDCSLPLS